MDAASTVWSHPTSLKEWADRFFVCPRTLKAMIVKGTIAAKQVSPRLWRIAIEDLPPDTKRRQLTRSDNRLRDLGSKAAGGGMVAMEGRKGQ